MHSPRALGAVLVLLFSGFAALYSAATPPGEGPDEPSHVEYVQYLAATGHLPVISAGGLQQAKHPPLYYAWAGLPTLESVAALTFESNPYFSFNREAARPVRAAMVHRPLASAAAAALVAMRWMTLLCGALVVAGTICLSGILAPGDPYARLLSATLVALLPQHLFMSGVVNNDAAAAALAAIGVAVAARLAAAPWRRTQRSPTHGGVRASLRFWSTPTLLGAVVGLGLLSKLTLVALIPAAALAILLSGLPESPSLSTRRQAARDWLGGSTARVDASGRASKARFGTSGPAATAKRSAFGGAAARLGAFSLVAAAVAGPWLARNVRLYGDPLAFGAWEEASADILRRRPLIFDAEVYLVRLFESFWGSFGWSSAQLPELWLMGAAAFVAVSATGLTLVAASALRNWRTLDGAGAATARAWLVATVFALGVAAGVLQLARSFDLIAAQGRYLFPALPVLAVAVSVGFLRIVPRRARRSASAAVMVGMLVGTLAGLETLNAAFPPPPPGLAELPPDVSAQTAEFATGLRLEGWQLTAPEPHSPAGAVPVGIPGGPLSLSLYWSARNPEYSPLRVAAHLVGPDGEVAARQDAPFFDGEFPPPAWAPQRMYRQQIPLIVNDYAPEGVGRLEVLLYREGAPDAPIDVTRGNATIEPVVIVSEETLARSSGPHVVARFDTGLQLRSAIARLGLDGSLRLDLVWLATGPVGRDLTVFVHVVDARGSIIAIGDGPPANGRWPTSRWMPGVPVVEERNIPAADGAAQVLVGLYDPATGERVSATTAGGAAISDAAVAIDVDRASDREASH